MPAQPLPVIREAMTGKPISAVSNAELAAIELEEDIAKHVDLLHASIWVPLSAPDHVHHERARRYREVEATDQLAVCRKDFRKFPDLCLLQLVP